jgi:transcriptional regulator with XRE-family HTH domain
MFNSIAKKINALMLTEGISGMQLARKLGIPPSTIKKIRSQEITNPTVATLLPIAKYFSVQLEYLLDATDQLKPAFFPKENYFELPIISWTDASNPQELQPVSSVAILEREYSANAYALSIDDTTKFTFPISGLIIMEPAAVIKHGDFILTAKRNGTKIVIKQYLAEFRKKYLRSLIKINDTEVITAEDLLLGVVMECRKQFTIKKIKENKNVRNAIDIISNSIVVGG